MNNSKLYISQYSSIKASAVYLNGNLKFNFSSANFESFAETTYKNLDIKYPKFYKMDNLSKLGFLCAEIVLKNIDLSKYAPEKIGINIVNKNSSIDTDIRYNNLVSKGASSPAIFVYSLPNIMIGEICIRHNIKGDNLLFVSDHFDTKLQHDYVSSLFTTNIIDAEICGWIDYTENNYQAFLCLIERNEEADFLPFTKENIQQLYKTIPK